MDGATESPIPRSALLFMAAVEEARSSNEGPFRAIAPLFLFALEEQRGKIFDIVIATNTLAPILGDNFTENALEAFLPQLASLGWLVEESADDTRSAYRVPTTLPTLSEKAAVESSLERLTRLYEKFQSFLEIYAPLLKMNMTLTEFQWLLFQWATSLDGSDKAKIQSEVDRIAPEQARSTVVALADETQRFSKVDKQISIEFSAFVKWLRKAKDPTLSDIASLTELGLAMEFLEEIRFRAGSVKEKTNAIFVLDAPILLDLLGLSGPSRKNSIERCLNTLRDHGAQFITLSHCLEELSDILKTIIAKQPHQRYGLTGDALRADSSLLKLATAAANQPDKAAKAVGITIQTFDPKNPTNQALFSEEAIDVFRNSATWHEQYKLDQRERDAFSIAFIMRRRQKKYSSDVLVCPFTFVTRNVTFTKFAARFVRESLGIPQYAFGPAIETKTLAALVWMKFGSARSDDLPQVHLIAACDRILAANGELLRRAERKLKEMKGDEAAAIILADSQMVFDLVVATGGSPEVLDAANGEELLRTFTSSAEERGRSIEREKSKVKLDRLQTEIAQRQGEIELQRGLVEKESARSAALDESLRAKDQEVEDLAAQVKGKDEQVLKEASDAANRLYERARFRAWRPVIFGYIALATYSIMGQFFIWKGFDWMMSSHVHTVFGLSIIVSTLLAAVATLKFLPNHPANPLDALHTRLTRSLALRQLKAVEPVVHRERVWFALRPLLGGSPGGE